MRAFLLFFSQLVENNLLGDEIDLFSFRSILQFDDKGGSEVTTADAPHLFEFFFVVWFEGVGVILAQNLLV